MSHSNGCCGAPCGPGYATPLDAFQNGKREKLIYVPCIIPDQQSRPDYLATVDVDPESSTYSQVIHRLPMPHVGDELHHSGWNACSSCYNDPSKKRQYLILPAVKSGRIYAVDVSNEREPRLHKVVEGEEVAAAAGVAYPHTSHCLGSGDIMVSTMGSPDGKAKGNFLLLDSDLKVKGTWAQKDTAYGYDFWYQPAYNIMVSSEFGTPLEFFKGFNPAGDVCMYDVSNPDEPRLASRFWLGGSIAAGGPVTVSPEALASLGLQAQPEAPVVKGVRVQGGPQMLQLSLDGRRLYVTNSLLSPWDQQFYPELVAKGSQLVQLDVDLEAGRLSLNTNFIVDFGAEPDGPVLAHECRYPGGDCSSDIWL